MILTDTIVEAAARAAFEVRARTYGFKIQWDDIGASRRNHYMTEARAAIEAALDLL